MVEKKVFDSLSDSIRSMAEGGFWLHEHKDSFQNQEGIKQIIEEYNSKINEKGIFEWTNQLSDTQIEGVRMALELEKEKRQAS